MTYNEACKNIVPDNDPFYVEKWLADKFCERVTPVGRL